MRKAIVVLSVLLCMEACSSSQKDSVQKAPNAPPAVIHARVVSNHGEKEKTIIVTPQEQRILWLSVNFSDGGAYSETLISHNDRYVIIRDHTGMITKDQQGQEQKELTDKIYYFPVRCITQEDLDLDLGHVTLTRQETATPEQ